MPMTLMKLELPSPIRTLLEELRAPGLVRH
jgi:hypothetical protein